MEDEVRQGEDQREGEATPHRTAAGVSVANVVLEGRNDLEACPPAGQLLQQALGRGADWMMGNVDVQVETWEETCAMLRMTPQLSPF